MKKERLLIISIFYILPALLNAQVIYFRNLNTNCFSFFGGLGTIKSAKSVPSGISFGINAFEIGLEYEAVFYKSDGENQSLNAFTPYIEYVILRKPSLGLSAGIGYLIINKAHYDQYFPVYTTFVLDLNKKNDGFILMPDLSVGRLIQYGLNSPNNNWIGGTGLMAMFRHEDGTSLFIHPGFSKSNENNSLAFTILCGLVFR